MPSRFTPFSAAALLSCLLLGCGGGGTLAPSGSEPATTDSRRVVIPITNPSFEADLQGRLSGWAAIEHAAGNSYTFVADPVNPHSAPASARIRRHGLEAYGALNQNIPVRPEWRGRSIELAGYLRIEGATGDGGGLVLQVVDSGGGILAWDHMADRKLRGTLDWKRYAVRLKIPANGETLRVGAMLEEAGTLWVDDLVLEIID